MCKEAVSIELPDQDGIPTVMSTKLVITYENSTDFDIYIPLGSDNKYKTKGNVRYSGNPPELFMANTISTFIVYTNDEDIQWEVKTPGCNNFAKSPNGSRANPCNGKSAERGDYFTENTKEYADFGEVKIYPNPFNEMVTLDINLTVGSKIDGLITIQTFDALGRLVDKQSSDKTGAQRFTIEMEDETPGIYFIKVSNNVESRIFRIIKE